MAGRLFNSTTLVFAAIIALTALWIGSGMIGRDAPAPLERPAPRAPSVAASWSEAGPVTRTLELYGAIEPARIATLHARTDGIVERIVPSGTRVEAGEQIGQLSTDDREARLARAEAQLAAAERDHDAARALAERGVGPVAEARSRFATLQAARADLRAVEQEIANTALTAPANGVINRVMADVGTYVSPGGAVAEIVGNNPLLAIVQVQQAGIAEVRPGMTAEVRFPGAVTREGQLRFVAPIADAATRTFRVEIEVPNPQGDLPAGLSAAVTLPLGTVSAHHVSPALIRLDAQGRIGVHVVDADSRIAFVPVEVVRARADGLWITGLGDRARIVIISQGNLQPGQQVELREAPPDTLTTGGAGGGAPAPGIPAEDG